MAITLNRAKEWLQLQGIDEDDAILQEMLDSAIEVIEEYTHHSLRLRTMELKSYGHPLYVYETPIVDIIADGDYKIHHKVGGIILDAPFGTEFNISLGISDRKQLETAVYQLTAYYYENREPDHVRLPTSVALTVNQLRRGLI